MAQSLQPLIDFIASPKKNEWLRFDDFHLKVYVRRSKRYLGYGFVDCLDIASIEVDEDQQGKGWFKAFLEEVEKLADEERRVLYIENILTDEFYRFFERHHDYRRDVVPNCFYRHPVIPTKSPA